MNYKNDALLTAQDMSVSFKTGAVLLHKSDGVSFQAIFSGSSPTGTFKVQASNALTWTAADVPETSWTDYTGATSAITASGDVIFEIVMKSKWARLVYTATSGSGSCTVTDYVQVFR